MKKGPNRLCDNAVKASPTNAPTCSGRLFLCGQQSKKGFRAHERHQLVGSEYANRSLEVVSVHRQGHFRFCSLQLAQQETTIPKQPLLEIAERVLNDGSSTGHHLRMREHSLLHLLKGLLMGMA